MTIDEIRLKDFLTFDDFKYKFEKRPLLVQGLNLTEADQKTNGTGKSGIQTAVELCITGSNSRGVRDNEIPTFGKPHAIVELFASCNVRKQNIHIEWTIKVKGSNLLKIKVKPFNEDWTEDNVDGKNDNDVIFSTVNDGKKYIINWFAITKEDLFNYYIINKTKFKSFFKSSNTDNTDLINRFSDASIISGIENIDTEQEQNEYYNLEKSIASTTGKIELLDSQIGKENNRDFKDELKTEVLDIETEIESIEDSIIVVESEILAKENHIKDIQNNKIAGVFEDIETAKKDKKDIDFEINFIGETIAEVGEELREAEKLVNQFVSTDWDSKRETFENDIDSEDEKNKEAQNEKFGLGEKETKLLQFIQGINVKLKGKIECPKCEHEFILDNDLEKLEGQKKSGNELLTKFRDKIVLNDAKIVLIKETIDRISVKVSKINKDEQFENSDKNLLIASLNEVSKKLDTKERKQKDLEQELKTWESDMNGYNTTIENYNTNIENIKVEIKNKGTKITNFKNEIKTYKAQISTLRVGDNEDLIFSLNTDKLLLEATITTDRATLTTIGDSIYEKNQWKVNFKKFKTFLANKSLDVIQYHCNRYLTDMGSDMRIKMEGYKVMSDGTIKEQITTRVIRVIERTFNSFSGGEQGRLLFSNILAHRHMINEVHPYGGLDFLCIDEVFEGVDALGLKSLIESAKTLNVAVLIITHVSDEEVSADKITIVKENSISRIKED